MNKWEKEVAQSLLDSEKETIATLERQYNKALRDIGEKIKVFEYDIARLDDALQEEGIDETERGLLESRKRSKVYQKTYQEALQGQVSGIVDKLQADEYETIDTYLQTCYDDAYIGELYNLQKQGVPVVVPIDQTAAVRAILTNSKLSAGLYARLGIDLLQMKTDISREITRGIASSLTYKDIARNIKNVSGVSMGRAKTIARTEGHRIQETSRSDVQKKAKNIGADVVKQWDSALDGKTRDTHRKLDGQIREIDKPFEVDGKKAMYPGEFGRPEEDINCRCRSNTRAKWALSAEETKHLGNMEELSLEQKQDIAEKLKVPVADLDKYSDQIVPIKAKDYEDFKRQYNEYWRYEGSDLQKEAEARIAGYKNLGKSEKISSKTLEIPVRSGRIKGDQNLASGSKEAIRYMSKRDTFYQNLENAPALDGYTDVSCHADPFSFSFSDPVTGETVQELTAKQFANRLRADGYTFTQPIRLFSCESGRINDGLAQQFADEVGVEVLAPTKKVYTNSQGFVVLADTDEEALELILNAKEKWNPEGWVIFKPRR